MIRRTRNLTLLACGAALLAACGQDSPSPERVTRGAVSSRSPGQITVNGVALATGGAAVRLEGASVPETSIQAGMMVTARGGFDDRSGAASEIEIEHALEGRVDARGADFVVVGGQRVHVDDSTEFGEDNPSRLASLSVGDVVAVSGVPDDHGGLRASRVDDSTRQGGAGEDDDDLDVKGYVSHAAAGSFWLHLSPDAAAHWEVDASGVTLPAGLADGARVEVHTLVTPGAGSGLVLGTIVASAIELEDRFGGVAAEGEVEVEGIVTSGDSSTFVIDGVTVATDGATRWELGVPADLVAGAKVEAEGRLDASGVLHATKVSFRAGVRITAVIEGYDGLSMTLLGVPVQLTSFVSLDGGLTLANGLRVEVRGNPSADGSGVAATRIGLASGNDERVFVRAVATAKAAADAAAPTFTVLGFTVTTAGAEFRGLMEESLTAQAFFAAVEPGRTVIKVRARSAADVGGTAFAAEELELEGND
jgi:hypothetical protein